MTAIGEPLHEPIRPPANANPWLRSAFAASEQDADRDGGDELMHGLFGSDAEHETGSPVDESEIHGESDSPGPQTADPSEARAPTILRSLV